jgi:hypothetical protein
LSASFQSRPKDEKTEERRGHKGSLCYGCCPIPMSVRSFSLGICPASDSLLAFTSTITRMVASVYLAELQAPINEPTADAIDTA